MVMAAQLKQAQALCYDFFSLLNCCVQVKEFTSSSMAIDILPVSCSLALGCSSSVFASATAAIFALTIGAM